MSLELGNDMDIRICTIFSLRQMGILVVLLLSSFSVIVAQHNISEKSQNDLIIFHTVVDEDGWDIPKLSESKEIKQLEYIVEGVKVFERRYEPQNKPEKFISFYSSEKGVLFQRKKYVELRSFSSLSTKGKIFCYTFRLIQVGQSATAGKAYFGPEILLGLYDMDGDGVFETRTYYPSGIKLKLPNGNQ